MSIYGNHVALPYVAAILQYVPNQIRYDRIWLYHMFISVIKISAYDIERWGRLEILAVLKEDSRTQEKYRYGEI